VTTQREAPIQLPPAAEFDRSRSAERIIESLKAGIGDGSLGRGARLPSEKSLAEHFGVSAPTVREAVRALAAMGLVEARQGSGTYVTADADGFVTSSLRLASQLNGVTASEIIEMLAVLNVQAAPHACEHATADDIEALAAARDAILAGHDRDEILAGVDGFLRAYAACAHRPLSELISSFLVGALVQRELTSFPEDPAFWEEWTGSLAPERAAIVEALAARDVDRLTAAVSRYHSGARTRLLKGTIDID
jgi:GntR family transcriptional repressor for pyruvate dehydrogenase complex